MSNLQHRGPAPPSEDEHDSANTADGSDATNADATDVNSTDANSVDANSVDANSTDATNIAETSTETSTYSQSQSLWLSHDKGHGKQRNYLLENERIMLNNWLQKIRIYQKATYRANVHYKHWDTILGLTPVILNTAVLLMEGYEFVYTSERIITITTYAIIAIATIVKAIHSFLKLSKQSESMRNVSDKLTQVHLQIQIYLAQRQDPIIPPAKFIEIIYKDITKLMEESANIPISIMSKYQSRLQELDTAIVDLSPQLNHDD